MDEVYISCENKEHVIRLLRHLQQFKVNWCNGRAVSVNTWTQEGFNYYQDVIYVSTDMIASTSTLEYAHRHHYTEVSLADVLSCDTQFALRDLIFKTLNE